MLINLQKQFPFIIIIEDSYSNKHTNYYFNNIIIFGIALNEYYFNVNWKLNHKISWAILDKSILINTIWTYIIKRYLK